MTARSTHDDSSEPFRVVIAGGGVAALEAALALHDLAGERVAITLLSPAADFSYRPMSVVEPFKHRPPRKLSLAKFAAERGVRLHRGALSAVDVARRVASTAAGDELVYDALLLAVGATAIPPVADVATIDVTRMGQSLRQVLYDIEHEAVSRLALIIPRPAWPLPGYELALQIVERAAGKEAPLALTIVTTEERPAEAFGEAVSAAVGTELSRAEIDVITGAQATAAEGGLTIDPGGRHLACDRAVALPRLRGPEIAGLPSDANGFLTVDADCQVLDAPGVFAAGDAIRFPVKFGGLAAQQADAAAAAIATLAGAAAEPQPFSGDVHGVLLGGASVPRLYFSARIEGDTTTRSTVSATPTASPDAKIAARYLGPYLDALWAEGPRWLSDQLAWETTLRILESQAPA